MKRTINKDFFKIWSSDMAYVLGFIFADGTITANKNGSTYFVLQIADKELLCQIRMAMKSEHKIARRVHKKMSSVFYRLQIGNPEIVSDLVAHGVVPQKAARMKFPTVPEEYLSDFVRGYFDGDGNVWMGEVHKTRMTTHSVLQLSFTSCSSAFLK